MQICENNARSYRHLRFYHSFEEVFVKNKRNEINDLDLELGQE
jgi:hypothetical protein